MGAAGSVVVGWALMVENFRRNGDNGESEKSLISLRDHSLSPNLVLIPNLTLNRNRNLNPLSQGDRHSAVRRLGD